MNHIFIRIVQRIASALSSRKSGIRGHVAMTTLAALIQDVLQAMKSVCIPCTYITFVARARRKNSASLTL